MRRFRFTRLVLAAAVIGAVGVFSLSLNTDGGGRDSNANAISQVDWSNADQTYPLPPGTPTPSPSYDGDGTSDIDGTEGTGDGGGNGPTGEAASPGSGPTGGDDEDDAGGFLNLAFPAQAGMSVGLLALAFLALLPGRRMPANLR
ncbi:hypothetical protein [Glycomyces paridis]|uniref:Uncharacterized protein n=1 Tax=Glycomyces paridis TaxID=2126555 RepID=A0A4S8PQL6_9ACTN|nr:hypothetical protein [Glycomyces paridis]THV31952.1 hypothetical protein E9998_00355 [Glycomyces paridis]